MIDAMTIGLVIVLCVMLFLLGILCFLYLKSKKLEKEATQENPNNEEEINKKTKVFSTVPVFDFMEFDKVEDNMICTKNGLKYIMVVECQGVNYDLMSEVEKNAVEEGFIQFLNTLRHPIQIYTQTRTINLESSIQNYRVKVDEIQQELDNEKKKYDKMLNSGEYSQEELNAAFYELTKLTNLYEYGKDIIYTTERMSLNKSVLNQKYYVVIPYYSEELKENDFDKQEIRNLAFSELYTRAQSVIRTLGVCGINGKVLDSNELVDLLYVAYNRDDAEIYGVDKALNAGYDELYSTAPDVLDKKIKALDEKIEREAFEKANEKISEAKSEKEKKYNKKKDEMEDLIDEMAKFIISQNSKILGQDVAENAIEKIDTDAVKRRGRPKKKVNKEGGTKEDEQERQTTKATKSA